MINVSPVTCLMLRVDYCSYDNSKKMQAVLIQNRSHVKHTCNSQQPVLPYILSEMVYFLL